MGLLIILRQQESEIFDPFVLGDELSFALDETALDELNSFEVLSIFSPLRLQLRRQLRDKLFRLGIYTLL